MTGLSFGEAGVLQGEVAQHIPGGEHTIHKGMMSEPAVFSQQFDVMGRECARWEVEPSQATSQNHVCCTEVIGPHPAVDGESGKTVYSDFCFRMKLLYVYRRQLDRQQAWMPGGQLGGRVLCGGRW